MMLENNNVNTFQDDQRSGFSNKTPSLSIIVPIYNTEKYLEECLDSILSQEFSDFEVLCVDDGSTDRSPQIIDAYARLDPRIKSFHINNQGVSYARNYALERARGAYIGFVDSDDWIDTDHFSILMKGFDDPSVDLSVNIINGKTDKNSKEYTNQNCRNYVTKELSRKNTFEAFFFDDGIRGYCPNKVFKKEMLKNVFNENISVAEDLLFCCQYAYDLKKTIYADCQTYHYRNTDNPNVSFLCKFPNRITGVKAEILITALLLQDNELSKCSNCSMKYLFNFYFTLVSYHSRTKNVEALETLRNYKPEVYKYLRIYCSSRDCSIMEKLKASVMVSFPVFYMRLVLLKKSVFVSTRLNLRQLC